MIVREQDRSLPNTSLKTDLPILRSLTLIRVIGVDLNEVVIRPHTSKIMLPNRNVGASLAYLLQQSKGFKFCLHFWGVVG